MKWKVEKVFSVIIIKLYFKEKIEISEVDRSRMVMVGSDEINRFNQAHRSIQLIISCLISASFLNRYGYHVDRTAIQDI